MIDLTLATANHINRNGEEVTIVNGEIPMTYLVINTKLAYQIMDEISVYGRVNDLTNTSDQEIL